MTGEGQHASQRAFEGHIFLSSCNFQPWKALLTGIEIHRDLCSPSLWKALPVPIQLRANAAQGTLCGRQQEKAAFGIIWKLMLRLMIHN